MKNRVPVLLLVLVSPALLATPERVADVLKDMQAHGYASPSTAVARLQAAKDAQDTHAPLEQRRRYYAALLALSLPNDDTRLQQQALDALAALAQQGRCTPCRAQWLLGKAQVEAGAGRLPQAQNHLEDAASLIPADDRVMHLQLALARARVERAGGNLNVAFRRSFEALDLANQLGDSATAIEASIQLGVLNAQLGFPDRAERKLDDAATQAQAVGYRAALAAARLNQGHVYAQLGQHAKEAHALRQALAIARGIPGLAYIEVSARTNLADVHLVRGDYPAAVQEARRAADLTHQTNDLGGESLALSKVGIALARMGRVDEGVAALRKSIELARRSHDLFAEADINQSLVKVLESAGRYKEALLATHDFDAINAKITQQSRDKAVLELQEKHEDERKNRQIEQLSAQARIRDAEAVAHRWQKRLWATLVGVAALATLLLLLVWLARARRANHKLTRDVAYLSEQSSMDELTGAFNRRQFASLMRQFAPASNARVGLAMLDIDHFKSINDEFGHAAGDGVLREMVRRLRALGRRNDHVVRWGGEEFVLVLPDAPPHHLPAVAERLLDVVASQPFNLDEACIHVTISIGCITHPFVTGGTPEHALRLADQALYLAKRRGRNRAICVLGANDTSEAQLAGLDLATGIEHGAIATAEIAGPSIIRTPESA